jgi:pantoate--beta-alanine ligase
VHETVREADGLARSSRNAYLSPEERARAPILHRALSAAGRAFEGGERDAGRLLAVARQSLEGEPAIRVDALDLVDAETMRPVERVDGPSMLAVAAFLGRTRLIDNLRLAPPATGPGDGASGAIVRPAGPGDGASGAAVR